MAKRLDQLEQVLSEREWLAADRFTAADLLAAQPDLGLPRVPGGRAFAAAGRVARAWVA
ncbi:glutathione binding-like protein [Sorangium sp. So ce1024]